jgi:transposase
MGLTGTTVRTHHHQKEGVHLLHVTRIGIDLAKQVFQVHGVDDRGHTVLRRRLARSQVRAVLTQLPPCVVGLEACGSAHYGARELRALGQDVRLMAPQVVRPYRKHDKNDGNDAEAICEAGGRPQMRFVPVKDVGQQAVLTVHRARQLLIAERTALVNHSRGLRAEFGVIVPAGIGALRRLWPLLLEAPAVPALAREVFTDLADRLRTVAERIAVSDRRVEAVARQTEPAQRLLQAPGIGPVTATALVATVGKAHAFKNGRQFAAWLGLVPRQHSSGGTRRCLSADIADSRGPRRHAAARATHRCHQPLGHGAPRATGLQQSRGGAGRQARAPRVGAAGHGTDLSAHGGGPRSGPGEGGAPVMTDCETHERMA